MRILLSPRNEISNGNKNFKQEMKLEMEIKMLRSNLATLRSLEEATPPQCAGDITNEISVRIF